MSGSDVDALRQDLVARRAELDEHLHRIERKLEEINRNVAKVKAEIGPGLPDPDERDGRPTVRDRLHHLEDDRRVIEMLADQLGKQLSETTTVVNELKAERDSLRAAAEAISKQWTKFGKIALIVFAAIGAFGTLVSIAVLVFGAGSAG